MKCNRPAIAGIFVLGLSWIIQAGTTDAPPAAKRAEHREDRHGATVIDNYYWLRDKSNPAVIEYLKAENAYTDAMTKDLKPFEEALYKEMLGRIKQTDLSVPIRRDGYYYYSRTEEGKQYPIQCRRKAAWTRPKKFCWMATSSPKDTRSSAWVLSWSATTLIYWHTPRTSPATANTRCT